MSNPSSLEAIRKRLLKREREYKNRISEESSELEAQTKKALRSAGIILGGLVVGFATFKLLAKRETITSSNKKKAKAKAVPDKKSFLSRALTDKLVAFFIHLGFSYLSKKIKHNEGDPQSTSTKQK